MGQNTGNVEPLELPLKIQKAVGVINANARMLIYVAALLRDKGFKVQLLNVMCRAYNSFEAAEAMLERIYDDLSLGSFKPKLVLFSFDAPAEEKGVVQRMVEAALSLELLKRFMNEISPVVRGDADLDGNVVVACLTVRHYQIEIGLAEPVNNGVGALAIEQ